MKINVTKTFLPPIEEYTNQVSRIWETHWATNRGPLVLELEEKLKNYLNINNILVTNNGTVPLQIALKLLGKGGEIITTPFSYVRERFTIIINKMSTKTGCPRGFMNKTVPKFISFGMDILILKFRFIFLRYGFTK
jgi:dTDP-4-amino-4,6-dideoxygalactose transaminase